VRLRLGTARSVARGDPCRLWWRMFRIAGRHTENRMPRSGRSVATPDRH
jgi:hypothetical protein